MTMTMERPAEVTNEWNHSCGPACGNCGNPGNQYMPEGTDVDPLPHLDAE